jgi:hypothetical protein
MNVTPVPDGQWPPRMELMKEAAELIGEGQRFRSLNLRSPLTRGITNFPDAIDPKRSTASQIRTVLRKVHVYIIIATSAAMSMPRTHSTGTISHQLSAGRTFGPPVTAIEPLTARTVCIICLDWRP